MGESAFAERVSDVFQWVGTALLIVFPLALAVAYAANENLGGTVVMGLFTLLIAKVFAWDEIRA